MLICVNYIQYSANTMLCLPTPVLVGVSKKMKVPLKSLSSNLAIILAAEFISEIGW